MKRILNVFILALIIWADKGLTNEPCLKSAKNSSGRAAYVVEDEQDTHNSYSKTESMQSKLSQSEITTNGSIDDEFGFSNLNLDFENLASYFDEDNQSSSSSQTKEISSKKRVEMNTEQVSEINNSNTFGSMTYARNSEDTSTFLKREKEQTSDDQQDQVLYQEMEDISSRIERLKEKLESDSEESSSSSSDESEEKPCHHHSRFSNEEIFENESIKEYEKSNFMNSMDMDNEIIPISMIGQPATESEASSGSSSPDSKKNPCHNHPRFQNEEIFENKSCNEYEKSHFANPMDMDNDIMSTPMMGTTCPPFKPGMNLPHGMQIHKSPSSSRTRQRPPLSSNRSHLPSSQDENIFDVTKYPLSLSPFGKPIPPLPFMPSQSPFMPGRQPLSNMPKSLHMPPTVVLNGTPSLSSSPPLPHVPSRLPTKPQISPEGSSLTNESVFDNELFTSETPLSFRKLTNGMDSNSHVDINQQELEEKESLLPSNTSLASETETLQKEKIQQSKSALFENIPSTVSLNSLSEVETYQQQKSEILDTESVLEKSTLPTNKMPESYNSPLLPTKPLSENLLSLTPSDVSSNIISETNACEHESEILETESILKGIPSSDSHSGNNYVSPGLSIKTSPGDIPSSTPSAISPDMLSEVETYQQHESEILPSKSIPENTPSLYSQPSENCISPFVPTKLSLPGNIPSPISDISSDMFFEKGNYERESEILESESINNTLSSYSTNSSQNPFSTKSSMPRNVSFPSTVSLDLLSETDYQQEESEKFDSESIRDILSLPSLSQSSSPKPLFNEIIPGYPSSHLSSSNFPPNYVLEDVEEIFGEIKQEVYDSYSMYPQNVVEMIERKETSFLCYEIIILGCGPASVQAAQIFSKHGKRTLIVEKALLQPYKSSSIYYRPGLLSSKYVTPYPASIPETNVQKLLYASNIVGDTVGIDENIWDLGTKQKFHQLAALSEKWSWENLSQFYHLEKVDEQSETFLVGNAIPLSRNFPPSPVTKKISRAFAELGVNELSYEMNSPRQSPGTMILSAIYENGGTASYTQKIFEQIEYRENVHIALGLELVDINFENGRAVSIVVMTPSKTLVTIRIEFELIIGGNVVDTVKWLYQCGIGDKNVLQQLQIPVRQHMPHVGKNVCINPMYTGMLYQFPVGSLVNQCDTNDYSGLEYVFGQNRIQPGLSSIYLKAFAQLHDANEVNVQFSFYAFSQTMSLRLFEFMSGVLQFTEEMQQFVFQQLADGDLLFILPQIIDSTSRGEINITRTEAGITPVIDTGMYRSERDMKIMIEAAEMIRELSQTKTFKICGGRLLQIPVPQCGSPTFSQEYSECSIRHLSVPNMHITGAARMGRDRHTSVVNDELLIHNFRNVRILNAAAIPFGTASESVAFENILGHYEAFLTLKNCAN